MPYAPFDLSGKTVLVTGANAGIGFGMANALAQAGARLVLWGRRAERNEEAAGALRAHGVEVVTQQVDIADDAQVDVAFAEAVSRCGVINAVFANAGRSGGRASIQEISAAHYNDVVRSNQFGTFYTVRAAARHMIKVCEHGGAPGSIVITGSSSMLFGAPGNVTYAMTKGALDALTRTLATELGRYGIRVNSILPGMIESEFGQVTATSRWIESHSSMKRAGRPSELGGVAVYLASDASGYHTGDSLVIDGGLTIHKGA